LEQVPREQSYDEQAFADAHLKGHAIVRFGYQTAWADLTRPFAVTPDGARGSTLRIKGEALVCAAGGSAPVARRPLGCAPRSVAVFAAGLGSDGKPEDPAGTVAIVATCARAGSSHEVVAICRPAP